MALHELLIKIMHIYVILDLVAPLMETRCYNLLSSDWLTLANVRFAMCLTTLRISLLFDIMQIHE